MEEGAYRMNNDKEAIQNQQPGGEPYKTCLRKYEFRTSWYLSSVILLLLPLQTSCHRPHSFSDSAVRSTTHLFLRPTLQKCIKQSSPASSPNFIHPLPQDRHSFFVSPFRVGRSETLSGRGRIIGGVGRHVRDGRVIVSHTRVD